MPGAQYCERTRVLTALRPTLKEVTHSFPGRCGAAWLQRFAVPRGSQRPPLLVDGGLVTKAQSGVIPPFESTVEDQSAARMELLTQIAGSDDWHLLYQLLHSRIDDMGSPHAYSLVMRLSAVVFDAQGVRREDTAGPEFEAFLSDLVKVLGVYLHTYTCQELTSILLAFTELDYRPQDGWMSVVCENFVHELPSCPLDTLIWFTTAVTVNAYVPSPLCARQLLTFLEPHLEVLTGTELTMVAQAIVSWRGRLDPSFVRQYYFCVRGRAGVMNAAQLVVALTCATCLNPKPEPELVMILQDALQPVLGECTSLELLQLASSFGQLSTSPSQEWMEEYCKCTRGFVEEGGKYMATLFVLLSRCSPSVPHSFLEFLDDPVILPLEGCSQEMLNLLLQAFLHFNYVPRAPWVATWALASRVEIRTAPLNAAVECLRLAARYVQNFIARQTRGREVVNEDGTIDIVVGEDSAESGLAIDMEWVAGQLDAVSDKLPALRSDGLAQLVSALDDLSTPVPHAWMSQLTQEADVDWSTVSYPVSAALLRVMARSRYSPLEPWWIQFSGSCGALLPSLNDQEVLALLRGLAGLEMPLEPGVMEKVEQHSLRVMKHTSVPDLVDMLACLVALQCRPGPAWMAEFESCLRNSWDSLDTVNFGRLVLALGMVDASVSSQWYGSLMQQVLVRLDSLTPVDYTRMIVGLSDWRMTPPGDWIESFVDAVRHRAQLLSGRGLPVTLRLLLKWEYHPGEAWMTAMLDQLAPQLTSMESGEVLMVLEALAVLDCNPGASFMTSLQQRLQPVLRELDITGVAIAVEHLVSVETGELSGELRELLSELILQHKDDIPPVAAVTLFMCLGNQQAQPGTQVVDILLTHMCPALEDVNVNALQRVILPLSIWQHPVTPEFAAAFCQASAPHLSRFNPLVIVRTMHFLASSGFAPSEAWVQPALEKLKGSWDVLDGQSMSSLLYALTCFGYPTPVEVVQEVGRLVAAKSKTMDASTLSTAVLYLGTQGGQQVARLRSGAAESFYAEVKRIANSSTETSGQGAHEESTGPSGVEGEVAVAQAATPGLDNARSSSSRDSLGGPEPFPQGASTEVLPRSWWLQVEERCLEVLGLMDGDQLTQVCWGFASARHIPSGTWLEAYCQAVRPYLPQLSCSALAAITFSLSSFGFRPARELLDMVVYCFHQGLADCPVQDIARLAAALVRLQYTPRRDLAEDIAAAGRARAGELDSTEVDGCLLCLGKLLSQI